jgi:hypothetical protein
MKMDRFRGPGTRVRRVTMGTVIGLATKTLKRTPLTGSQDNVSLMTQIPDSTHYHGGQSTVQIVAATRTMLQPKATLWQVKLHDQEQFPLCHRNYHTDRQRDHQI